MSRTDWYEEYMFPPNINRITNVKKGGFKDPSIEIEIDKEHTFKLSSCEIKKLYDEIYNPKSITTMMWEELPFPKRLINLGFITIGWWDEKILVMRFRRKAVIKELYKTYKKRSNNEKN